MEEVETEWLTIFAIILDESARHIKGSRHPKQHKESSELGLLLEDGLGVEPTRARLVRKLVGRWWAVYWVCAIVGGVGGGHWKTSG